MDNGKRVFERVYICMNACIEGFNRGLHNLGWDLMGAFLKAIARCY